MDPAFYYAVPVILCVHIISSFFGLAFPFYELIPELECMTTSGVWASWSKEMACTTPSNYRVDWNSRYSIVNLMTENDLICEEDYKIGMLGAVVFFGFVLSAFTIMPLPDILGRKPVLIVTTIISTLMASTFMFLKNINHMYIALFIFGFTVLVRGTTSYVYLLEIVPEHYEKRVVMTLSMIEKMQVTLIPLWFYILRDWRYQVSIFLIVSSIGAVYLFWIPESPKFMKNKQQEQRNLKLRKEYSDR